MPVGKWNKNDLKPIFIITIYIDSKLPRVIAQIPLFHMKPQPNVQGYCGYLAALLGESEWRTYGGGNEG